MHNGVLDNPYSLPYTIHFVTESRSIRWTGNLAHLGERKNLSRVSGMKISKEEIASKTTVKM